MTSAKKGATPYKCYSASGTLPSANDSSEHTTTTYYADDDGMQSIIFVGGGLNASPVADRRKVSELPFIHGCKSVKVTINRVPYVQLTGYKAGGSYKK